MNYIESGEKSVLNAHESPEIFILPIRHFFRLLSNSDEGKVCEESTNIKKTTPTRISMESVVFFYIGFNFRLLVRERVEKKHQVNSMANGMLVARLNSMEWETHCRNAFCEMDDNQIIGVNKDRCIKWDIQPRVHHNLPGNTNRCGSTLTYWERKTHTGLI